MRASNIGSQRERLPRSCSTSMCYESFKHWLPTRAFTPILFDIYVLRELQTLAPNASVYPDVVRHLCVARDSRSGSQRERLPRSCSTSMCCERLKHRLPTRAFTPMLFDIYVLREIQTLAPNTSVYPDLVRHLCVARDSNIGSPTRAFTPILFDIYVLREIQTLAPNTSVYPDLVRHLCVARDSNIGSPTRAFTPILFDIYVLREIQTLAPNTSVYPDLVRHLCVARDSNIGSPTRAFTPILFDIYVLREIQTLAPNTSVYPDLVRHLCVARDSNIGSPTRAFTPILFDIYVLREIQTLAPNTSVYPDLVRHLCVARDSNIGSPTRAFTPILFDIYVLREIQTLAPNTSVYPDLVRHLCVARDSNIGSPTRAFTPILFDIYVLREIQTLAPQHKRLPRSCSTSMCCERFKHWLPNTSVYPDLVRHLCVARDSNIGSPTRAFTPILFDIYVLREIQTLAPNTSVYPDLVRHLCVARDSNIGSPTRAFTPILFDIYVLREIQTLAPQHERLPRSCSTSMCCERFKHWLPNASVYPDLVRHLCCERFKHWLPNASVYPDLVRHLCVARDSNIGSPTRAFTPILFDIYVLREIQTLAPQHERLPRSCSTSMCCERFKHWLPNTSVYPDLVRHLCVARDSNIGSPTRAFTPILFDIYVLPGIQTLAPQRERLPRSCSTSMCCERFKHWLPNTSVYPDLDRHLCVARDSNIGSPTRSCSTSMCCERFKHWLPNTSVYPDLVRHLCVARDSNIGSPTRVFTPILFDIYVLREIQTLAPQHERLPRSCSTSMCCERFKHWLPNTSVYPDLVRHLCVARDSNIGSPTRAFTPILFDIYVLREIQTLAPQHERLPRSCSTSM